MTADIGRMYWAATKALPDQADLISAVAKSLAMGLDTLNVQAALAGDSPALTGALSIGGDVHAVLRSAVISLNNAAQAVLATAADYARTDDEAREDLHRLGLRLPSVADPSPASAGPALPDLAAPGATTDIDILGIHIEDVKVGTTPDPTDVGYEQGQQMDGPDLPATPTPGAH
ncbi:hypothetical protein G5V59_20825 [Nocardioides sp. W3-2-3]|uniref:hypothetical protein n=1 Tax=Nocardioides convexus TaxID=2712224 RepID=UPI0024185B58|nr:hypothetical protein [Nocardioides convexus]NHA01443.1 hypothetical protein [Nocardioides convexus]